VAGPPGWLDDARVGPAATSVSRIPELDAVRSVLPVADAARAAALHRRDVPPAAAGPRHLALGGESRTVTVLFADVVGFTTLSEGREPADLVKLMNECFTELTDVIQGRGGTVDKFIGDAIMAFWNAPADLPDPGNASGLHFSAAHNSLTAPADF
jgi:class 3 adenylate cyclase